MKKQYFHRLMAAVLTAGLVVSPLAVSAAPNDAAASSVNVSSQSVDQSSNQSADGDNQDSQASIVTPSVGTSDQKSDASDQTSDEDNSGDATNNDDVPSTNVSSDSANADHTGNAEDKEKTENQENTENSDSTDSAEDSSDQLSAEEVGKQIQDLIETSTQSSTTSTDAVADMQDQAEKIQEAYDALPEEEQALLDDSKEALDNAQASLDTYQDALQEVEETGTVTIDPNGPANSFRYINGQPVAEALADVEQETAQAEAVADGLDPELVQEYNIQPTEASTTNLKSVKVESTEAEDQTSSKAEGQTGSKAEETETSAQESTQNDGAYGLNIIELPAAQTELLGAVSGAQHRGIDVSQFQHTIDWDAVKNSGIEFAIIRCGDGPSYNDSQFERNVSECERLGIPYGVYLYGRATSEAAAQQEAAHTLSLLGGHMPQLPVYYDIEENSMRALGNSRLSSIAKAYCTTLLLDGYDTGVYSSTSWWQGSGAVLSNFASNDYFYHWVAQWADANTYRGRYECWQYKVGDAGTVPGINTRIDMDYWYGDLSAHKADAFFNGGTNFGAGVTPMYRMYNPNSGEHFYTGNKLERNMLFSVGWNYEGIGWFAPSSSGTPVYRLYNPNAGDHHYTMNKDERDMLVSVGWNYEGVGWYSDDSKSVPLYRQYNPNAVAGAHNYTTNKAENDYLASIGWNAEGIGWYGLNITY